MNSSTFYEINKCRISKSSHLINVLSLGTQALTGVFPTSPAENVPTGPLDLVLCPDSGLVQLKQTFCPSEMYGKNYGYRSGLNKSMVNHLTSKIEHLESLVVLKDNDLVLDIGSNDGTTLRAYSNKKIQRVGIDPSAEKLKIYYDQGANLVVDFFSAECFYSKGFKKAKVVTSISMFYDLDDPIKFAQDVESVLTDDGIWHLEQSYLPAMLRNNSYDTICHEHLEYYSLHAIQYILNAAGLKAIDVATNNVNGGSFEITACKSGNKDRHANEAVIQWMLNQERKMNLLNPEPYRAFEARVFKHRENLRQLINCLNESGKKVLGYGASTKGNVLLQFCGLTSSDIHAIAEVNYEKFGCYTPGTSIPIVSEKDALEMKPDFFLVMPWHFRENILTREAAYRKNGGKFIFPFPEIEIV
jgi:hypothetical protein